MSLAIDLGHEFTATTDDDGYPAVRARNVVWSEPDEWITASTHMADAEDRVRELAAALTRMADEMRARRQAGSPECEA